MVNERRCAQRPVYGSSLVRALTLEAPVDMPFLRGWHGPSRLQLLPGLLLELACSYEVRAGAALVQTSRSSYSCDICIDFYGHRLCSTM
jgi:hypothetical protein